MKHLLIAGGGFAGLWAALASARQRQLNQADFSISLVSKDPYLTIRPRLYESNPELLRAPLLPSLQAVGVDFVQAEVSDIDSHNRTISLRHPDSSKQVNYDKFILATGSELAKLPIPGTDEFTFNIDNYNSAIELDQKLRGVLQDTATKDLTLVVIGAGFTGIELALELPRRVAEYRNRQKSGEVRILVVDQAPLIGKELGDKLRPLLEGSFEETSIETRLATQVSRIYEDRIELDNGETIATPVVINTSGLRASPLTRLLGGEQDTYGRLPTDSFLRATNHEHIFLCGDVASAEASPGHNTLMSCQHAMPMGRYAGHNAARELLGLELSRYSQPDYVTCLDLGNSGAVFSRGWQRNIELTGDEAKKLKQKINREWIYPPSGDRNSIFQQADINAKPKRSELKTS